VETTPLQKFRKFLSLIIIRTGAHRLNIRVKIADFSAEAYFECDEGSAECGGKEFRLPPRFSAQASTSEKIEFALRLYHLHWEKSAIEILKSLPEELACQVDIIPVGERWEGRGIPRFWLVKGGFARQSESAAWREEAVSILPAELARRMEIEGGVYRKYPSAVSRRVSLKPLNGQPFFQSSLIRLHAPLGIKFKKAPVGETFHWEHTEDLWFNGHLELRAGENGLLVINELPLEDYLASVNSSEMSAQSPLEFLKAQTIAARGTVLATMGCHHYGEPYHLCNGDHCQCFYGVSRVNEQSIEAAESTAGQVLLHNRIIADTRYAKICGGMRESFDNVWEEYNPPYLPAVFDGDAGNFRFRGWEHYVFDRPRCWCNPEIYPYPDYYDFARDLFRWREAFTFDEIGEIIRRGTGCDIGALEEIAPLNRGASGRIIRLMLQGDGGEIRINGELNVRRALSPSHLPSSCFTVEREDERIILHGAGWGHGVGMCQMGALNMALRGADCVKILKHYYPHTELVDFFG